MIADLHNSIELRRAISPVSVSDNTAQTGQWVDRAGFDSLEFAIILGSLADADATFAVTMQDANASDQSDAASVDSSLIAGTLAGASFQFDDDNKQTKVGYLGGKRYVRIIITPNNNSSAALLAAVAILCGAHNRPRSTQKTST